MYTSNLACTLRWPCFGSKAQIDRPLLLISFSSTSAILLRRREGARESDKREMVDNDTIYGYHATTYISVLLLPFGPWEILSSCVQHRERRAHTHTPKIILSEALLLRERAGCLFVRERSECQIASANYHKHNTIAASKHARTVQIFVFSFLEGNKTHVVEEGGDVKGFSLIKTRNAARERDREKTESKTPLSGARQMLCVAMGGYLPFVPIYDIIVLFVPLPP